MIKFEHNFKANLYNSLANFIARKNRNAANLKRKIILPSFFLSENQ